MKRNVIIGAVAAAVVIAAAIVIAVVPFGSGTRQTDQAAQQKTEQLFTQFKQQGGTLAYKSAEADGEKLVIKGLSIKPAPKHTGGKQRTITIDELRINAFDWAHPKQPAYADIEVRGLRVQDLAKDPQFQEFSRTTGLADLLIQGRVKYRTDPAKRTLDVETMEATVDGIGTYKIQLGLDGVDMAQLQTMANGQQVKGPQALAVLGAIRLRRLSVSFKDMGGMEKFFKYGAAREGTTPEDLRKKALAQVEASTQRFQSKLTQEWAAAVKKFLENPGTLEIAAKPPAPLPVVQMVMGVMLGGSKPGALDALKQQLGLSIAAN